MVVIKVPYIGSTTTVETFSLNTRNLGGEVLPTRARSIWKGREKYNFTIENISYLKLVEILTFFKTNQGKLLAMKNDLGEIKKGKIVSDISSSVTREAGEEKTGCKVGYEGTIYNMTFQFEEWICP